LEEGEGVAPDSDAKWGRLVCDKPKLEGVDDTIDYRAVAKEGDDLLGNRPC